MAKMFYSLEESAEVLGVSADQVKQMASEGKLQQFRDRDKLMFKREAVDALASNGKTESDGPIGLADTSETDAVDLKDQTGDPDSSTPDTKAGETGISVFETDEIEHADPMAQTQVTQSSSSDQTQPVSDSEEDDLALESVGSGSGLLDLTRASDDTSLGAELLDEIYPGGGSGAGESNAGTGTGSGASGVFDSAAGMETGASGPSGLENLGEEEAEPATSRPAPGPATATYQSADQDDPIWSGLSAGLLLGACIALILGLIVAISALSGTTSAVTTYFIQFNVLYASLGLLVICAILGVVGALIGKAAT